MSASGRCTYLLFLVAVLTAGVLPRSWFGYEWHSSPTDSAFFGIVWVPFAAWAILGRFGGITGIVIFMYLWRVGELTQAAVEGNLMARIELPVVVTLTLLLIRLLHVRLIRAPGLDGPSTSRKQYSIGDLMMAVVGIAAIVQVFCLPWRRSSWGVWHVPDGIGSGLMTVTWFGCLGYLILGTGYRRRLAGIPAALILTVRFYQLEANVRDGYFKIVSWEHPAMMAGEFLGTQILFVVVSLLVIRRCGFRLSWQRPSPRRSLNRFVNRNAAVVRALGPAPTATDGSTS